ncbi:MAG: hypothetical protein KME16_00835 [Scytolyngbya sp. HA4215-MV1]|jgi:hypothetical protein|nr:hypothetical protein [Scytolyngbya sp. HA4215-MV1]
MIRINRQLSSVNVLRKSIWFLGILLCLFGMIDQVIVSFSDNHVSYLEFFHFLTAAFLFISWIVLRPAIEEELSTPTEKLKTVKLNPSLYTNKAHLLVAKNRMLELQNYHIISQLHILPFPYLSQIYHLLNLKHLETVHKNSLSGLKVIDICEIQPTALGGSVKFRTTLTSPINLLKIWRQPIVDVELTLHTPYTIELRIPVYGGKKIVVLFNVLPLTETTHEFLINIYTDLPYPKFLLWFVLHLATFVTLYEDLPYLKKLSERGFDRLLNSAKASSRKTVWLFQRFVNLHASTMQLSYEI